MKWYIILIIILICVLLLLAVIITIFKINKSKKIRESNSSADLKVKNAALNLGACFGGKENIKEIKTIGSRVSIIVEDISKVDKEKINGELSSVMYMGNKIICIIGSKSEEFSALLKEYTNK